MKHPKTTIIAILIAMLIDAQAFMDKDGFNLKTDWISLLLSCAIAGLGVYARDRKPTANELQ